jgi:hypothetical protein
MEVRIHALIQRAMETAWLKMSGALPLFHICLRVEVLEFFNFLHLAITFCDLIRPANTLFSTVL